MAAKEVKSRIKINRLLEESGWHFLDGAVSKPIIALASNVKLRKNVGGCVNLRQLQIRSTPGAGTEVVATFEMTGAPA